MHPGRVLVGVGVFWLGLAAPASAQVLGTGIMPVVEVGQQLWQATVTAAQSVMQTFNQVLELTPIDEMILSGEFARSMGDIEFVLQEATGLANDISSLQRQIEDLFDLERSPDSLADLKRRLAEIRKLLYQQHVQAMKTQNLVCTTISAISHLRNIVGTVGGWVGNKQAHQMLAQLQATMVELLSKMQVQQSAYHRSRTVEHMGELMTVESLRRTQARIMADHPVRR